MFFSLFDLKYRGVEGVGMLPFEVDGNFGNLMSSVGKVTAELLTEQCILGGVGGGPSGLIGFLRIRGFGSSGIDVSSETYSLIIGADGTNGGGETDGEQGTGETGADEGGDLEVGDLEVKADDTSMMEGAELRFLPRRILHPRKREVLSGLGDSVPDRSEVDKSLLLVLLLRNFCLFDSAVVCLTSALEMAVSGTSGTIVSVVESIESLEPSGVSTLCVVRVGISS